MTCPCCDCPCDRDEVDIGVGVQYGPWFCNGCGWSEADSRCEVCGWPLKERKEDGCVRGNCSMRPKPKVRS